MIKRWTGARRIQHDGLVDTSRIGFNAQDVSIDISSHGLRPHDGIAWDLYTANTWTVKARRSKTTITKCKKSQTSRDN